MPETLPADNPTKKETLSVKALREQRLPLTKEIRRQADAMNAPGVTVTAEMEANWEAVNADYNALSRRIDRAERADAIEAAQVVVPRNRLVVDDFDAGSTRIAGDGSSSVSGLDPEQLEKYRCLAISAWARTQFDIDLTDEERHACKAMRLNPSRSKLDLRLIPTRPYRSLQRKFNSLPNDRREEMAETPLVNYGAMLSEQTGASGGFLVPPETLLRQLEINMLYYGGMRQVSESIRTATGERMSWPTANDTTNTGVQVGESAQAMPSVGVGGTGPASVDPTFGKVFWDAYKFSSQPVLVPYELLEDSVFDIPAILGQLLGIRLGRVTNTKFTVGSGAATCKGLITAASQYAAASSTAIAVDDLINLIHQVDPAYRTQKCGFMMHDLILLIVRKLKDGIGNYIWQSGLQQGVPDRLLSYGLTINQDMDSTTASGKNTIAFGLLSNYKIRTVGNVRMYRLQERYRDTDQDGFIALLREDGNLLDAGTHPVKLLHHT
jgi:HK97 family phage major capsid protein